ncbi:hypothetical protein AB0J43_10100 [Nonomuraea fuscirosea]
MGSVPLNTALKPTVVGGFALDDFVVETSARNVTCLAGHTALVGPRWPLPAAPRDPHRAARCLPAARSPRPAAW